MSLVRGRTLEVARGELFLRGVVGTADFVGGTIYSFRTVDKPISEFRNTTVLEMSRVSVADMSLIGRNSYDVSTNYKRVQKTLDVLYYNGKVFCLECSGDSVSSEHFVASIRLIIISASSLLLEANRVLETFDFSGYYSLSDFVRIVLGSLSVSPDGGKVLAVCNSSTPMYSNYSGNVPVFWSVTKDPPYVFSSFSNTAFAVHAPSANELVGLRYSPGDPNMVDVLRMHPTNFHEITHLRPMFFSRDEIAPPPSSVCMYSDPDRRSFYVMATTKVCEFSVDDLSTLDVYSIPSEMQQLVGNLHTLVYSEGRRLFYLFRGGFVPTPGQPITVFASPPVNPLVPERSLVFGDTEKYLQDVLYNDVTGFMYVLHTVFLDFTTRQLLITEVIDTRKPLIYAIPYNLDVKCSGERFHSVGTFELDESYDIDGIEVHRSVEGGVWGHRMDLPKDSRSFIDTIEEKLVYYYKLRSYKIVGGSREYARFSDTDSVVCSWFPYDPLRPANFRVIHEEGDVRSNRLSWTYRTRNLCGELIYDITGFKILRRRPGGVATVIATLPPDARSYLDVDVGDVIYEYAVAATAAGEKDAVTKFRTPKYIV